MTRQNHLRVAWFLGGVLFLLHFDFWRPQRVVLYLGWVPEELAYRLVWVGLATAYLAYFCRFCWRPPSAPAGDDS